MKKRTKKKLAKFAKKTSLGLLKLIFVYPVKGLIWLSKQVFSSVKKAQEVRKEKQRDVKIVSKRPKIEANYDALQEVRSKGGELGSFESMLLSPKKYNWFDSWCQRDREKCHWYALIGKLFCKNPEKNICTRFQTRKSSCMDESYQRC